MKGVHPPTSHFQNCFDVYTYNFFITSNLFDSNKPYALSTVNRKCANKIMVFGEALRIKVKKFNQNLPKNY